jgi:hypothetical protein
MKRPREKSQGSSTPPLDGFVHCKRATVATRAKGEHSCNVQSTTA